MLYTAKLYYADGCVWEGQVNEHGQRDGRGKKTYPNGATYEGVWLRNHRHGWGYKTHADGTVVRVQYINGEKQ